MPSFLVLGFHRLLLLPDDGEGAGWIRFLHGDSVEDEGDISVNNFIGLTTWRLGFPNGDIKTKMMSSSWNNFLWTLLHFVVVRSYYDKGLGRISLPLKQITGIELGKSDQFSFFFGGRRKKKEDTRN